MNIISSSVTFVLTILSNPEECEKKCKKKKVGNHWIVLDLYNLSRLKLIHLLLTKETEFMLIVK